MPRPAVPRSASRAPADAPASLPLFDDPPAVAQESARHGAPDAGSDAAPAGAGGPAGRTAIPLAAEIDACRRCELWRDATRGVPGEGPTDAALMLVGEQPGDVEDRAARPFVGPAGRLLDEILARAGIERERTYLTNAVKHFKWEPRGTRRIHKTPAQREVTACRAWLEREIAAVAPRAIVALGATAARALLGPGTTVDAARRAGPVRAHGAWVVVTWHPSALLRAPDETIRERMETGLAEDLARAAALADTDGAG